MKIDIGGEEVEAELGFETLVTYEEEFGRDLIKDFFGKAEVPVGEEADGSENTVTIDFTQTNWTAITRVAWAAIRTATPSLPGYREWLKGVGETNLRELNEALLPEAVRKFFR